MNRLSHLLHTSNRWRHKYAFHLRVFPKQSIRFLLLKPNIYLVRFISSGIDFRFMCILDCVSRMSWIDDVTNIFPFVGTNSQTCNRFYAQNKHIVLTMSSDLYFWFIRSSYLHNLLQTTAADYVTNIIYFDRTNTQFGNRFHEQNMQLVRALSSGLDHSWLH